MRPNPNPDYSIMNLIMSSLGFTPVDNGIYSSKTLGIEKLDMTAHTYNLEIIKETIKKAYQS